MECCRYVLTEARAGNVQIWTSALTLAEVFKHTSEGKGIVLKEADDMKFESFIEQDFVTLVQVGFDIGLQARRLLRKHIPLKKPPDAIHLATAVLNDLDELHTYDAVNLLPLHGLVKRADGALLTICNPPQDPSPQLFPHAPE